MSTVLQSKPVAQDNLAEKLNFQQKLQTVTNKIHATKNLDEIILELSQELCNLFNADRLTIYLTSEDKGSIISKVKTGLNSFKDIKLPINEQSIAGFVARAQAHDQHPRRLRRRGAEVVQPAAELPEGGRREDRLPHQADAGRARARAEDART